jgi:hypothetical protein
VCGLIAHRGFESRSLRHRSVSRRPRTSPIAQPAPFSLKKPYFQVRGGLTPCVDSRAGWGQIWGQLLQRAGGISRRRPDAADRPAVPQGCVPTGFGARQARGRSRHVLGSAAQRRPVLAPEVQVWRQGETPEPRRVPQRAARASTTGARPYAPCSPTVSTPPPLASKPK